MSYWRSAGMSYLRYQNLCAQATRQALKHPVREQAIPRGAVNMSVATWRDGKPPKPTAVLPASKIQAAVSF